MRKQILAVATALLLAGCIRPQNYHATTPTFALKFPDNKVAYEAYIEMDARGQLFDPTQVDRAVGLIQALKHPANAPEQPVAMFLFVHGWKNNASEDSGNVWGFRQMLDRQAAQFSMPVVGIYIGWPGDATKFGKFFSFWNRESVADSVGAGDLDEALPRLLVATKGNGPGYKGEASTAILIGHSFGGLVLERAVIRIINAHLAKMSDGGTSVPPADLILLLNEAGPASQARPFLLDLLKNNVRYEDENKKAYPLLVSMTSDGDAATKIAFPGGEFVSPSRPKTVSELTTDESGKIKLDAFGQSDSLPYNLLSPANMVALRSHQILPIGPTDPCASVKVVVHGQGYCVTRIVATPGTPAPANTTPYWIMALPQVFVPDHGSVFRDEMFSLIDRFITTSGLMPERPLPPQRARRGTARRGAASAPPPPPPPTPPPLPAPKAHSLVLRKGKQ